MPPKPKPDREDFGDKLRNRSNSYLKYSGMAIQMAVIIVVFTFGGRQLDAWLQTSNPYFTIGGALFGIFGALYATLKDFIHTR